MSIIIRECTKEDIPDMANIHVDAWKEAYQGIVPQDLLDNLNVEKRMNFWKSTLEKGTEETYCCLIGSKIIGFITIGPSRDENENNSGEIWGIYLDPMEWSKGYGSEIFNWTINIFKNRKFDSVILWAFDLNKRGEGLYKKFDFQRTGETKSIDKFGDALVVKYKKKINYAQM